MYVLRDVRQLKKEIVLFLLSLLDTKVSFIFNKV